ncbi:unnamed protein product [Symbiodinium sp. CCMP2592]|nr:unnamed protein product [Symbiodinium sp. CCMP2592]
MNDCYKKLTELQASAATTDSEKELARLKKDTLETYVKCPADPDDDQEDGFLDELLTGLSSGEFWDLYQEVDPSHPVFTESLNRKCTLPYFLHGDEGRGRHSFCSRLIFTAIPARCYNGDATIFDLLQNLADDCSDLFWNGDWVWLRKAFCLETGFSSKRICHMCEQEDWYNCSSTSDIRTWSRDDVFADPWKDDYVSPLRSIPGADDPWRLRTDPAHTFAIQGFGSGMATSAIVLLSRLKICPGRATQELVDVDGQQEVRLPVV